MNSALERLESLDSMEGIVELGTRSGVPARLRFLPGAELVNVIYPGVLVTTTVGIAAMWLAQHYGAPVMLFALLIGMAFHFLHEGGRCVPGIEFSSRTVLRVGVGLLGVRITTEQIIGLGIIPALTVIVGVVTTILVGLALAKRLKLQPTFGVLSGGSVAICGASAALAIATVLPRRPTSERDTILTVVAVTTLSTLAMIFYPILVGILHLDNVHAGVFLGGTIHDVAQVVGAGYMISPETGDIATCIKLLRVAMLVPVVFVIGLVLQGQGTDGARAGKMPKLPLFLIGFVVFVILNSAGFLPPWFVSTATDVSRWCLVIAIAALGMKTSFRDLVTVGWRPILLMLVETAWIAAVVLISVKFVL